MTVTPATLIESKIAVATNTVQYTAGPSTRAVIGNFTATNYDTVARSISVNLIPSGGTVGDSNLIIKAKTLQPGTTYAFPELTGKNIAPGASISTLASNATGITINAGGYEYT
jgi:hypothetical protein